MITTNATEINIAQGWQQIGSGGPILLQCTQSTGRAGANIIISFSDKQPSSNVGFKMWDGHVFNYTGTSKCWAYGSGVVIWSQ